MEIAYNLFKSVIDPVIIILAINCAGIVILLTGGKKKLSIFFFLFSFLFFYGASISPVSNMLCYYLEKDYLTNKRGDIRRLDIIVVLGGGIAENKSLAETMPSLRSSSRILHGVQVFKERGASYFVCSGKGIGRMSEAEVIEKAAMGLGVSKDKIKLDRVSRNTWEHAIEIKKMFPDPEIEIGLVTSAYHMKRSEREFRRYFHNIRPLPSEFLYSTVQSPIIFSFIPNSGSLYKTSTALNEIIGLGWYTLKKILTCSY
jgi:uncharacterized SAM-binding protein YcdF (DUF218 family)